MATPTLCLDECVHDVILPALRQRGVDVTSVKEQQRRADGDEAIFRLCVDNDWCLVTYDSDFLVLAARWQEVKSQFPGVIYARGNTLPLNDLIEDLTTIALAATREELRDRVTYLPLRN